MSESVVTRTVVVTDPQGVHVRTAGFMAKIVGRSQSQVTVVKGDRRMPANDVFGVLEMMTPRGETLLLEAVGPDAKAVLDALEPLFAG
jgi:phosphocarrier protein HPr